MTDNGNPEDTGNDRISGRYVPKLSKQEIAEFPLDGYDGPVKIVRNPTALAEAVSALEKEKVLGFDTETRPAFRKGQVFDPSLIQLGTADCVYLIQIAVLKNWEPLLSIFEDPAIVKAGVALDRDIKELQELIPFTPAGFVDLAPLSDQIGVEANGLRALTAILLGFRISKSAQTSNWASPELSKKQISYAATDAYVGREMYMAIMEEKERLEALGIELGPPEAKKPTQTAARAPSDEVEWPENGKGLERLDRFERGKIRVERGPE